MTLFNQQSLQEQVQGILRETPIPAGHCLAVFGAVDFAGARAAVVARRKGDGWELELAGEAERKWSGETAVSVRFKTSW